MIGFVAIHRQIKDNFLWKDKPFSKGQAWIDILLRVNHKPNEILIGNQVIKVGKGETVWSILDMSKEWGWSRKKVENFLNVLEKEKMLYNKRTTKYTIVTVAKWESYQYVEQQKNIKRTSSEHQTNTNNNDNNENNENNDNKKEKVIVRFTPPTPDEVRNYCIERNNNVDADKFVNFYESKGWLVGKNKMKSWKAAVRTWEEPKNKQLGGAKNNGPDFEAIIARDNANRKKSNITEGDEVF